MLAPAPFALVRVTEGKEDDCLLLRLLERERCSRKKINLTIPDLAVFTCTNSARDIPWRMKMTLSEMRQQN
jgi:hypothetical protein